MQRSKQGCGSVLVKEYSLLLSLSLAYTSHHECPALCLQRLKRLCRPDTQGRGVADNPSRPASFPRNGAVTIRGGEKLQSLSSPDAGQAPGNSTLLSGQPSPETALC